jgi:hypothetical protein
VTADSFESRRRNGFCGDLLLEGAKNVAVAKELIKYATQPKVLNEYLKAGLGRWMLPVPDIVRSDPFWLNEDRFAGPRVFYWDRSVDSAISHRWS